MTSNPWRALELMMRTLLLISATLLMTACGAYAFPGSPSPSPSEGTVTGHVIAIPCTPVQTIPNTCGGRPMSGLQITYQDGSATESTTTDARGDYSVQLPPGAWNVRLKTYMRVISGPTSITIAAGSAVVANYILDSGIRAPVPTA